MYLRAEGARENFGIFDEEETFWRIFLSKFEQGYSPVVPIGTAGENFFKFR